MRKKVVFKNNFSSIYKAVKKVEFLEKLLTKYHNKEKVHVIGKGLPPLQDITITYLQELYPD